MINYYEVVLQENRARVIYNKKHSRFFLLTEIKFCKANKIKRTFFVTNEMIFTSY